MSLKFASPDYSSRRSPFGSHHQEYRMTDKINWKCAFSVGVPLAVFVLSASVAAGQSNQIKGVIVVRSSAAMTVQTQDSSGVIVALTPSISVVELEGVFRKKHLSITVLIPGLSVDVKGSRNEQNPLVVASQAAIAANKAAVVPANKRFGELADYNFPGEATRQDPAKQGHCQPTKTLFSCASDGTNLLKTASIPSGRAKSNSMGHRNAPIEL
jgi:hypothetical protein